MRGGYERERERESDQRRGAERELGERMNGLAATAGAVWLKLRSDFTYRTPPDHIRTYVLEVR